MKKMRMYFLTFSCFFFKVLNRSQKNGILPGKRVGDGLLAPDIRLHAVIADRRTVLHDTVIGRHGKEEIPGELRQ